jgi:hypothetical protein
MAADTSSHGGAGPARKRVPTRPTAPDTLKSMYGFVHCTTKAFIGDFK